MEPNEMPNSEIPEELNEIQVPELSEEPDEDLTAAQAPEDLPNLEICPNCLEPNTDNLAVCRYCGQPLRPGMEMEMPEVPETPEDLEANRRAAAPESKKEEKKQESGFRRVMPWLGLYIIYYAITGIIETSRQEDLANPKLAYASWGIYIAAGLLMAWPLLKKLWNKIHPSPEPAETEDAEEELPDEDEDEPVDEDLSGDAPLVQAAANDDPADQMEALEQIWEADDAAYNASGISSELSDSTDADQPAASDAEGSDESGFEEEDEDARWL